MSSPSRQNEKRQGNSSSERHHSSSSEIDDQILPAGQMPYPNYLGYESRSSTLTPHERESLVYGPGSSGSEIPGLYGPTAVATPVEDERSRSVAEFKAAKDSAGAIGTGLVAEEKKPRADVPAKTAANGYLDYADGLRGIAMIMVFNGHFIDNTFVQTHPRTIENGTPVGILRSPIGLILFYMLSGRLNATSYFRNKALGRPIRWTVLPEAMIRRSLRLLIVGGLWVIIQKVECGTHAFDQTVIAEGWLQSGNLGYPLWCNVDNNNPSPYASDWNISTSIGDIVVGLLRMATNRDYLQQLLNQSMLWSIVPQLWGMLSVLMLLPILMHLRPSRRFTLYALLLTFQGYTYNQNIPFTVGAIAADLKASGYIKKFNQKSRIAFLLTEVAMAAFFVAAYCYNPIFVNIDRGLEQITDRDGVLGYDITMFTAGRMPSYLIMAGVLYYWLEMSAVLQWLIGNFAFKALGRVALGFYVCQMSIIYGIMPYLVIYFRDRGYSFWSNMWSTWCITFFFAYIAAWLIAHTIDKWAMIFSDWFASTIVRYDTLTTLRMAALNTAKGLVYGPPAFAKATPGWLAAKWAKTKHVVWTIFHWRTMVAVPAPPSHPMEVGLQMDQVHSTLFDADISDDEQAVRTRWMLRALSYMGPIQVGIILGLGFVWMWFNPWADYILDGFANFSTVWRLLWALALPYCIITTLGFATPDITRTPEQLKKKPVIREHIHRLFIVSVTRGSNPETTRRAHLHLKKLEKYHPAVRAIVLTDEPYYYPDLDNVMTPKAYKSPLGKAKHKAKALDYFRSSMNLTPYDWVLHMDEESTMDAESLRGCLDFIRYNDAHIGQGIIIYNGKRETYWKNWFFAVADCIRVGDELARFSLQGNIIKRPVFGVHGSFLMINGDVENKVTWDFGSLAEDFEFSQAAWSNGFTLGRIHGVVREQSPEGWMDFIKQRRRWYMGIRGINGLFFLPQIAIKLWTAGIFCLVATLINIPFSLLLEWSGPTPRWLYVISCFCFGNFYWLYYSGLFFSEIDYGYKWSQAWQVPVHAVALLILQPIMAFVEGCAVIYAMSTEDGEVGFQVIKK
ncbi:related to beta 1,4-mannosyltransferase (egghead protein) [Ustilago bromivora]|uniref:Related to beta 1,4-mannosyltransferase (Egghead protein) n=1 Tax=Ustilago bromivora TaxID=307758 RepID=A0A1K0G2F6_9BASI|nr:related to beta 1,4-mannosyltransferase (egghead protein) [Ustilago bromivora]SYW76235.1 related to beta 1,4-mannosyltransferase (egghead protein) [Ustilago bromivora]